jgi:hypothetical protein
MAFFPNDGRFYETMAFLPNDGGMVATVVTLYDT